MNINSGCAATYFTRLPTLVAVTKRFADHIVRNTMPGSIETAQGLDVAYDQYLIGYNT